MLVLILHTVGSAFATLNSTAASYQNGHFVLLPLPCLILSILCLIMLVLLLPLTVRLDSTH